MFTSLNGIGAKQQGERAVAVVDALGEVAAGFTADEAKHATAHALVDLGKEPTEKQQLFGDANKRAIVRLARLAEGNVAITFLPVPKAGEQGGR